MSDVTVTVDYHQETITCVFECGRDFMWIRSSDALGANVAWRKCLITNDDEDVL